MKKIFIASALSIATSLFAGDFVTANAIMQDAVRTQELNAKTKALAKTDSRNIDELIASASTQLSLQKQKIAKLQNKQKAQSQANAQLLKEIEKYRGNLKNLSKFLDKFYAEVFTKAEKKTSLKDFPTIEKFNSKSVTEKLQSTVALVEHLKTLNKTISLDKNKNVSSGLFVTVSGKISGNVSEMKVERNSK